MESLDGFIKKQEAALDQKRADLEALRILGPIPGLDPWLLHGRLYGIQHVAFKLLDMGEFLSWAKENCRKVLAVEGKYKGFYPEVPETRDYVDSVVAATGDIIVDYSTITQRHSVRVFFGAYRFSFDAGILGPRPVAHYKGYSPKYYGIRSIESWSKPGGGLRQYLRISVDRQAVDLETLFTFEQFEALIPR